MLRIANRAIMGQLATAFAGDIPIGFNYFFEVGFGSTLSRLIDHRPHHSRIHAHLDVETLQMLRDYANANALSASSVIRQAVRRLCAEPPIKSESTNTASKSEQFVRRVWDRFKQAWTQVPPLKWPGTRIFELLVTQRAD
jgi:hypothetical protein